MRRKEFLAEIRRLEELVESQAVRISLLEEEVNRQAALIAAYKEQNTRLIEFVENIADSKSKFGKEARRILSF